MNVGFRVGGCIFRVGEFRRRVGYGVGILVVVFRGKYWFLRRFFFKVSFEWRRGDSGLGLRSFKRLVRSRADLLLRGRFSLEVCRVVS